MLKHIVMWKLKPEAEGKTAQENALEIKNRLEGLKTVIPEVISLEVGIDLSKTDQSFDVVLNSEFNDPQSCSTYANHPDHLEIAKFIGKVAAKRIVVDYNA